MGATSLRLDLRLDWVKEILCAGTDLFMARSQYTQNVHEYVKKKSGHSGKGAREIVNGLTAFDEYIIQKT